MESTIISLAVIKPSAQMQERIDIEMNRECRDAADYKTFKDHLRETQSYIATLTWRGKKYYISAMAVMLDDDLRLKPEFNKAVIEDAFRQAVLKQYPERKHVQIEISLDGCNEEESYFEYQASVWWDYRRQYEQLFFYVRY